MQVLGVFFYLKIHVNMKAINKKVKILKGVPEIKKMKILEGVPEIPEITPKQGKEGKA